MNLTKPDPAATVNALTAISEPVPPELVDLVADWLSRQQSVTARRAERDVIILELRRRFYGEHTDRAAAEAIAADAGRFLSTSWPRDRQADAMPARYIGTPRELLWRAMRLEIEFPAARHIRRILADG